MRLLLTGGGTGGHVYPALSVVEALRAGALARTGESVELLFAGTLRGDAATLSRDAGIPFTAIRSAALRGRSPVALVRAIIVILGGLWQAWRLLGEFKPRAVLATGGYASVPVSLAARLRGIPLVVFLPDVHPGWAVRLLAKFARRVATTSDAAVAHLPRSKTRVTGYPVRPEFWSYQRAQARAALGLQGTDPVVLVTGASQGSRVLNDAVLSALPALLTHCVILHQTGAADLERTQRAAECLDDRLKGRYHPLPYLPAMAAAMAAADLAVMRSGASSLAEPPAAGLPTILVPGRYAGAHQRQNAAFMAARGAAILLEEHRLTDLPATIVHLLEDEARLHSMSEAARMLARPNAAQAIADIVLEVAA